MPILTYFLQLFFLGMLFPPIYFCLWSWQLYALIAYKRELNEANYLGKGREIEKEVDVEDEQEDYDGSTLRSDNPFAYKYKISESESERTVQSLQQENKKYNFDAHCSINNRFDKWCGRSLIAFSCQVCLIVVIICAVVFAREKQRSNFPLQA